MLLFSISCTESNKVNSKVGQKLYSIFLGEFKTQDKVEEFRLSLNQSYGMKFASKKFMIEIINCIMENILLRLKPAKSPTISTLIL